MAMKEAETFTVNQQHPWMAFLFFLFRFRSLHSFMVYGSSGGSHSTILVTHDAHIWLARARAMKLRR
eukprot:scaffold960_cov175-Amphora_coffeaeformis.AAC.1